MTVPASLEAADPALRASVSAGLDAVEARLREVVASSVPSVTEVSRHLVDAGGKRFRPLLALLAGHLGDGTAPGVVDAAVVVELTHLASLYHDDVMDEAPVRRGAESANSRWTNSVAILTGDYLFARASDVVAGLGPEAVRIQARAFARLVEGQMAETAGPAAGEDPVAQHLQVVSDKTGSLIAASAHLGALAAGVAPEDVATVAQYAELVGIAFQLSDDLIDVSSDSAASGKTPGTDLREGVRTLPSLLVLGGAADGDARLRELVAAPVVEDDVDEALRLLRAHPAMAEARRRVQAYVDQARATAERLPAGPAREALVQLADFVVDRSG